MAGATASGPVLIAVATALNVSGYTGVISGSTVTVTNDALMDTACPYTVVGVASETRDDTFGLNGKRVIVELHHFSEFHGDDELAAMRNKAFNLLHYEALTVTGNTVIGGGVQFQDGFDLGIDEIAGVKRRHWVDTYAVMVKAA